MGFSLHRTAGLLGFALALLACGEPKVGGSGRLEGGVLVLEGTPREMGWWHGHLLKDRIRRLHEDLRRASRSAAPRIEEATRTFVDLTLPLLPERLRQELDGIAAGSGLAASDLLGMEVGREALRFEAGTERLLAGPISATSRGTAATWRPEGPDAERLSRDWVLFDRRPPGAGRTVVLGWPGSLGGVAGLSHAGLAVVVADRPLETARQSLKGAPFLASVRWALENAGGAEDFHRFLSRTTAHEVVLLEPGRSTRVLVAHIADDVPLPVQPDDPPLEGPVRLALGPTGGEIEVPGARATFPGVR